MSIELPPDFYRGIELFNEREFFECHEVLEDVWRDQVDPEKQLTQGIIQIAVALYHAGRSNFVGACKLMERGIARVEKSLHLQVDLNVSKLLSNAITAEQSIKAGVAPQLFTITASDDATFGDKQTEAD